GPGRSARPAPIEDRHGKAPGAELAHALEIFLDEFGAALEDADRAAPLAQRRLPAGVAQAHALARLDIAGRGPDRDRVLGCRYQIHRELASQARSASYSSE